MNFPSLLPRILPWVAAFCFALTNVNSLQASSPRSSPPEATAGASATSASVLMDMARESYAEGHPGTALRHYKTVIRRHSTSRHAPEAHFESALIRMERKQWSKAFDHFQEIIDHHPDYPEFNEVIRKQYSIADALRDGARLRLFWRVPGFRSPERAVEYFETIVENAPYSDVAPSALLKAADLQADRKRLDEAIDLYDRFISDYPQSEKAADAYFGLAEAFSTRVRGPAYDQGANREAISYYEDFILLHPRHPRAPEAEERIQDMRDILAQSRVVLGDFYFLRRSNYTAARVFYNEAISISPVSPSADEAREKLRQVDRRAERAGVN